MTTAQVATRRPLARITSLRPKPVRAPAQVRIDGLCYPSEPGSEIDARFARSIVARRDRAVRLLEDVTHATRTQLHPSLQSFLSELPALSALDVLRLFDNWWAGCLFAAPVHQPTADIEPAIGDDYRLAWAFCASIAGSTSDAFSVCPPGAVRGAGGRLYLPDQHALFDVGHGPVAGFAENGRVRFVCSDGVAFTYRGQAPIPRGSHCGGRLHALQTAAGWPVLNAVPVFGRLTAMRIAGEAAVARALPTVAAGVKLLDRAWPAAAALASRIVRGIVIVENADAARSHTGPNIPQVIMCTAERPELVAEALCHELSHIRMNLILEQGAILSDDTSAHPSPWRADPRPLIGLVHGVHAFLNVRKFYERLGHLDAGFEAVAARIVARQTAKIRAGWSVLEDHARWTAQGEPIAADLRAAVEAM
jgi:HEXXH motif-containing protein